MNIIALAGGIGAGKSMVSRMLRAMGYEVYDTDSAARRIMDSSSEIKQFLQEKISPDAVSDAGVINREAVAAVVFSDAERLAMLNEVVHSAVRADMRAWANTCGDVMFVESAIAVGSGIADEVDAIWEVSSPEDLRIKRICMRGSGMTPAQALARIDAQRAELSAVGKLRTVELINDNATPLLPQLEAALRTVR